MASMHLRRRVARTPLGTLRRTLRFRPAHRAKFEQRLVWIFGSPRSGSSWLLQILAEHSDVLPVDEPLIGHYFGPFLSDLPGASPRALGIGDFTLRRVQADKDSQFFCEHFSEAWLPGLARLLRERYWGHVMRHAPGRLGSPPLLVIKEPNGSQSADLIMRALPRARLLFLLRDGRDVVDSELSANLKGSWASREFFGLEGIGESQRLAFAIQSAHKWLWRTEVVQQAFAAHPGPKLEVRYEDLVANTRASLRRIYNWLGLAVGDAQIDDWIRANAFESVASHARGPDQFHRAATPGHWRESLRADEQAALHEILNHKLDELGYAT
jgi:hypothetical protein